MVVLPLLTSLCQAGVSILPEVFIGLFFRSWFGGTRGRESGGSREIWPEEMGIFPPGRVPL